MTACRSGREIILRQKFLDKLALFRANAAQYGAG